MPIKVTTSSFIKNAISVHGNRYNYSNVNYIKSSHKVIINCHIHGNFMQSPNKHLEGKGCPQCGFDSRCKLVSSNTIQFINKAIKKHGDKYNYSNVNYVGKEIKVEIGCAIHGMFMQTPHNHLAGNGCPKCRNSKGEALVRLFLEKHGILYIPQKRFDDCRHILPLPFDFYLPDYNLCIEYQGIQHFKARNKFGGETELTKTQIRDSIKAKYCNDNNITLIIIPYYMDINTLLYTHILKTTT